MPQTANPHKVRPHAQATRSQTNTNDKKSCTKEEGCHAARVLPTYTARARASNNTRKEIHRRTGGKQALT